ncbi:hypothetical protein [Streptomyces sp. RTd22]|uniref:MmyB family transcriptional regulator n=1 Tax=Streptomyces sp. RTd22 TaxID=1841249 RepID=UPI000B18F75F
MQQDGDALNFALVADLRAALVTYPRDRGLVELVEELRSPSAEFARLWDEARSVGMSRLARPSCTRRSATWRATAMCSPSRARHPPRRLHGGRGFRRCGETGVPAGHERRSRRRLPA